MYESGRKTYKKSNASYFICKRLRRFIFSLGVAVIQWIMSCHKKSYATHVITLWCIYVTSLITSVSTMSFNMEIMFNLKAIKSHFNGSFDIQNPTYVVISYEIYETSLRRVS